MDLVFKDQGQQWQEIAHKAWETRKLRMLYEKQEQELFQKLIEISENNPSKGGGFVFNFIKRKGFIDYATIPYLQSIDLEPYRKPDVVIWKLEKE